MEHLVCCSALECCTIPAYESRSSYMQKVCCAHSRKTKKNLCVLIKVQFMVRTLWLWKNLTLRYSQHSQNHFKVHIQNMIASPSTYRLHQPQILTARQCPKQEPIRCNTPEPRQPAHSFDCFSNKSCKWKQPMSVQKRTLNTPRTICSMKNAKSSNALSRQSFWQTDHCMYIASNNGMPALGVYACAEGSPVTEFRLVKPHGTAAIQIQSSRISLSTQLKEEQNLELII